MDKELYFENWKIDNIFDDKDRVGNPIKRATIGEKAVKADIPLSKSDLALLQTILGCDINELTGKDIIAVNQDFIIRAIGYQGLYIPLYYKDNKKIFSESELCELLDCFNIVRLDEIGNQITSYEVPTNNITNRRK